MSTPLHARRPKPQQATARVTTTGRARGPLRSPHATADALVVEHLPFAAKVAANYARRTGHPKEDLEQLAESGRLDLPNEVIVYLKNSGYAIIMTIKEDSEPQLSSIFPSLDGDLVVDIIFEVAEIQFITVSATEE